MESDEDKNKRSNIVDRILGISKNTEKNFDDSNSKVSEKAQPTSRQFKPNIKKIQLLNQQENINDVPSNSAVSPKAVDKQKIHQKNHQIRSKSSQWEEKHKAISTMGVFSTGIAPTKQPASHKTTRVWDASSSNGSRSAKINISSQPPTGPDLLDTSIKVAGLFGPVSLPLSSTIDSCSSKNLQNLTKTKLKNDCKADDPFLKEFLHSTKKLNENDLLLIQLPTILPLTNLTDFMQQINISKPSENSGATHVDENEILQNRTLGLNNNSKVLKNAREGWLGRLQYFKSGRMILNIGNNQFNVKKGSNVNFLQQIYCMQTEENPPSIGCVGKVVNKLVIAPDIDGLIQKGRSIN